MNHLEYWSLRVVNERMHVTPPYSYADAGYLAEWLAERAAGYPNLKQFEGGANWPELPTMCDAAFAENGAECSACGGATWGHRNVEHQ